LIGGMFDSLINDYKINTPCPYGDGHSAPRVVERLRLLVFERTLLAAGPVQFGLAASCSWPPFFSLQALGKK